MNARQKNTDELLTFMEQHAKTLPSKLGYKYIRRANRELRLSERKGRELNVSYVRACLSLASGLLDRSRTIDTTAVSV